MNPASYFQAGLRNSAKVSRRELLWHFGWAGGLLVAGQARAQTVAATAGEHLLQERASRFLSQFRSLSPAEVRETRTTHFLFIGAVRDAFRDWAGRTCESLWREFDNHFRSRGFVPTYPSTAMPVFLLPDRASFERLLGPRSQGNYGGFYRTDLGCLVVHDQQGGGARGGRNESAMAANLRCLSHEGTHQLCYRSGLLRAGSDIPLAIAEGLAVYGECYMTQGHEAMGQINQSRLNLLFVRDGKSAPWISFDSLLADDRLFDATHNDTQASVAYAQAWLLVHYLLNSQPMLPRFRKYLETIRTRPNREQRMEDVARELGDPTQLLARIRRYGMDLPRRGRSQYESRRRTPASSPP